MLRTLEKAKNQKIPDSRPPSLLTAVKNCDDLLWDAHEGPGCYLASLRQVGLPYGPLQPQVGHSASGSSPQPHEGVTYREITVLTGIRSSQHSMMKEKLVLESGAGVM